MVILSWTPVAYLPSALCFLDRSPELEVYQASSVSPLPPICSPPACLSIVSKCQFHTSGGFDQNLGVIWYPPPPPRPDFAKPVYSKLTICSETKFAPLPRVHHLCLGLRLLKLPQLLPFYLSRQQLEQSFVNQHTRCPACPPVSLSVKGKHLTLDTDMVPQHLSGLICPSLPHLV